MGEKTGRTGKLARSDKRFLFWSVAVLALLIFSLLAPHLARHDPYEINLSLVTAPPDSEYWMGNDYVGRCIFCRLLHGAARSIFAAVLVVMLSFVIGTLIGTVCGYAGGRIDIIVMRLVDAVQAFPNLIFSISVAAMLGSGLKNCIIAMVITGWTQYARLARTKVLDIKKKTYVRAARVSGMSGLEILLYTILPNSLSPLIVAASMHVGNAILSFSGLSFLGLGSPPPYPEWGPRLNDGRSTFQTAPWTILFPGAAIVLTVMIMGMFGDSLNAKLDPRKDESDEI